MLRFQDIIGHETQIGALQRALEGDSLHHAQLFVGSEGIGKRSVALALAAAIQCENETRDACGECPNCLCLRDGNHPDVHWVELRSGKKEIGIDQVRELQKQLVLTCLTGSRKVALIDPMAAMNVHAQNALLKTLEEPPNNCALILIANSVGGLLPTVLSRCVRLQFASLGIEQVAAIVEQSQGISKERAKLLATLSHGSLGKALGSEVEELLEGRRECLERLAGLSATDTRGVLNLAEEMGSDRDKSLKFLDWVKAWVRDLVVIQVGGAEATIYNQDLLGELRRKAAEQRVQDTASVLTEIDRAIGAIRRNYNRRLVLEGFIPKLLS